MKHSKSPGTEGKARYPMRKTYKGRKIVVRSPEESLKLVKKAPDEGELLIIEIDGRPLEVLQKGRTEHHSAYLPYKAYSSPLDLAKDIIDYVPSFRIGAGA